MTERITELERERTAALAYMEVVNHRGSLSLAVRAKVEKVPETAILTRLDLKSLSYAVKCSCPFIPHGSINNVDAIGHMFY